MLGASRLTGETDCLLRLVVPAVEVYDAVYKKLIACLDLLTSARSSAWRS
ncbi:Lrp/AsnC ligand binding domain-containing protein [Bradyrhizobium brasilense]